MQNRNRLLSVCLFVALCDSTVPAEEKPVITAADALQSLKDGNSRFVRDQLNKAAGKERLIELVKEQHPIAAVIACADSRVSPELIFNHSASQGRQPAIRSRPTQEVGRGRRTEGVCRHRPCRREFLPEH